MNSVMKDKNEVDVRFAMCFPDVYEIGMSHLGIQILYDMFNQEKMSGVNVLFSVAGSAQDHERRTDSAICTGISGSDP
mgnify:CR=1 FL=1